MNPVAIESHLRLVLVSWSVIIAAAWICGRLGKRIGQPLAVGEIAAGLLLGPSAFGALWPKGMALVFPPETQPSLQLLSKLGLILLLFQVGMEFDFRHAAQRSRVVTLIALMGILAPASCGLIIGPWLHRNFAAETPYLGFQVFICLALSISALPIMGRIFIELGFERTPWAAIAISAAAVDDVVGWILLAAATALVTSGFDPARMFLQIAGVLGLILLLRRIVGPVLIRFWRARTVAGGNALEGGYMAALLIAILVCSLLTNWMGIFSIFGAFLLGVSLSSERSLAKAWRERLGDFVVVAWVPIFFTYTGLRTNINSFTGSYAWVGCLAVLLAATVGKMGGCWLGGRWGGLRGREAWLVAASMNTRALMGLVVINVGFDLKLLNQDLFTMFVIMALVTTVMTGPLLRLNSS